MMENPGNSEGQEQPVKPSSNWPATVGAVVVVMVLLAVLGVFAWKLGWLSDMGLFPGQSEPPIEVDLNPSVSSEGEIARQYEWDYGGRNWTLDLRIPKQIYDYYRNLERAPIEDYSVYVTHPNDDEYLIDPLATELKNRAALRGYDLEETVNFTASFVQSLRYEGDAPAEYPNYPVETLMAKKGDCEDMAILTAALLQSMDYDAVLIRFSPPTEGEAGHMAVGASVTGVSGGYSYTYDGKIYYYLETTSVWPVGEMPPEILSKYQGGSDAIYKLEQAPALHFSGALNYTIERRWFSGATVDVSVTVTNWGTANAEGFYVKAFFEERESGAKSSDTYDLAYRHRISGIVIEDIAVPSGADTILLEVWLGGEVVDDWHAELS